MHHVTLIVSLITAESIYDYIISGNNFSISLFLRLLIIFHVSIID